MRTFDPVSFAMVLAIESELSSILNTTGISSAFVLRIRSATTEAEGSVSSEQPENAAKYSSPYSFEK